MSNSKFIFTILVISLLLIPIEIGSLGNIEELETRLYELEQRVEELEKRVSLPEKDISYDNTERKVSDTISLNPLSIEIPNLGSNVSIKNMTLRFTGWLESDRNVNGPYSSGYYTFFAEPNMKFVILFYEIHNKDVREQTTPSPVLVGEILTDFEYYYKTWNPRLGIQSKEHKPRSSNPMEIQNYIGNSGGATRLLPGQYAKGQISFQIPSSSIPIQASFVSYDKKVGFK